MLPYYRILGVDRSAGPEVIKKAYRRLARKFHPDHNGGSVVAEQRFRLLAEAYEVLGDTQQRQKFDRYGVVKKTRSGVAGGVERFVSNLESLVESRLNQVPKPGKDTRLVAQISLAESCLGAQYKTTIQRVGPCSDCQSTGAQPGTTIERCHVCNGDGKIKRSTLLSVSDPCLFCNARGRLAMDPCQECNGKGECERQRSLAVDIPPGVAQGRRLVLRGQGAPGQNGGKNGDLFVEVDIQAHPLLSRDGADLHCHVPIRISEAVLGATIEVPLLDGSSLRVKVPMNTPNGQVLRLRNRGVPLSKNQRGDLLIHVELETPAIEADAIALMEQLDTASQHPRRNHYEKVLRKCVK